MSTTKTPKPFLKPATNAGAFFLWSVLTFNLYEVYWGWQMWEVVRQHEGATYKLPSWFRAISLPVSIFWLLPKLQKITGEKTWPLDPPYLATLYLVIGLGLSVAATATFASTAWWVVLASVIGALPLYFVVRAVELSQHTQKDIIERLPQNIHSFLVGLLSILFMLSVLGLILTWLGIE